jgi:hypothetical protein
VRRASILYGGLMHTKLLTASCVLFLALRNQYVQIAHLGIGDGIAEGSSDSEADGETEGGDDV